MVTNNVNSCGCSVNMEGKLKYDEPPGEGEGEEVDLMEEDEDGDDDDIA